VTKPLTGKRIAVAGGRKFNELAAIIAKQGGEALCRPMMGSVSNDSTELAEVIRKVCEQGAAWFVLVTGVGTKALLEKADELGLGERLRELLGNANIAARGYKTFNALKTLGLKPVIVDDDGTVEGVRRQLEAFDFSNKYVAVQLHGERMPVLTDWLLSQGATVTEIPLYFYEEPEEKDLQQLLFEVISDEVDAVAFTSNTQVKFFFEGARRLGAESFLQKAFDKKVIALSVGSMTTSELKKHGITRIIAPEHERMGAMVVELAKHYQTERHQTQEGNSSYPIVLTKLSRVVVVGGGHIAERKVKALIESNVTPIVVSPDLAHGLLELKTQHKLTHLEKRYHATDLQNAQLVIAATNDEAVNKQIANDAVIHNVLCNVVDNPELGNVHTVGTVRRGDLLVTVSSNGKSPALTRYIKEELEQHFSDRYVEVLEVLHIHRDELAQLDEASRHQIISELISNNDSRELEQKLQELLTFSKGLQPLVTLNSSTVVANLETAVYVKESQ
jgi:uroporphyrinogen-III synthase